MNDMPNTDRKLRVFLCHSSQDKPTVRELYQRLLAEGWIDPWLDEEKLLPGQDWGMEIEKTVEAADVVIVCLSTNSVTKEGYVQRELKFVLDIALEKPEGTIFIIPLRLENVQPPRRLRSWQYVDYFPVDKLRHAYQRLSESLKLRATSLEIKAIKSVIRKNIKKPSVNLDKKEETHTDRLSDIEEQAKTPISSKEKALLVKEENRLSREVEQNQITSYFDEILERLPLSIKKSMKKEIAIIKEFFKNKRAPKIMIIGSRGAGKSSLINAIFGEKVAEIGAVLAQTPKVEWYQYKNQLGEMQILDTRGLNDSKDTKDSQAAMGEIESAIAYACPDVILFVRKAKQVDENILQDLEKVAKIYSDIYKQYRYKIPVVGVVSQVDELDPVNIMPPYDDSEKNEKIKEAVAQIENQMRNAKIDSIKVIPISTLAYYDKRDNKTITYNRFWNVDQLVEYIIKKLPKEAQVELARLSRDVFSQTKLAKQIITTTAILCGAIAATPNLFGDIVPITSSQVSMVIGIAYLSGREANGQSAKEFLAALGANIGTAYVFREIASVLGRIVVPVLGGAVSATIAYSGTWAIGKAAIAYFIEKKSMDDARKIFKRQYEKPKDIKE